MPILSPARPAHHAGSHDRRLQDERPGVPTRSLDRAACQPGAAVPGGSSCLSWKGWQGYGAVGGRADAADDGLLVAAILLSGGGGRGIRTPGPFGQLFSSHIPAVQAHSPPFASP